MQTYVVERYWPGVTQESLRAATRRLSRSATETTRHGSPVRHVRSTLIPGEEYVVCVFEATSAGAVREVNQRADVPFERVVEAVEVDAFPHQ